MAGQSRVEGTRLSGPAAAATTRYLRVLLDSSGNWAIAGDVEHDGECDSENITAAADEMICYVKSAPGTHLYVANTATIAVGDVCNSVAGGKVTDAAGVAKVCVAVTAAAAADDIFEGIPRVEA